MTEFDYGDAILEVLNDIQDTISEAREQAALREDGYGVNEVELRFLVRQAVMMMQARLDADHDPETILMSIWDLFEHPVRALVDGRYEETNKVRFKDHQEMLNYHAGMLREFQDYALSARSYINDLEKLCAKSKLAKLQESYEGSKALQLGFYLPHDPDDLEKTVEKRVANNPDFMAEVSKAVRKRRDQRETGHSA